jgi:hypothetical protein
VREASPVDAATGRGEITGGCGFQGAPAECIAWTKKTSATPTARGNLLDNPVEDDVPITRGLSLRELDAAMAWQMPDTMLQNTLLDRGRAKKEAFTILARALLRVIYHLLRTGDAYDPAVLNKQSLTTAC